MASRFLDPTLVKPDEATRYIDFIDKAIDEQQHPTSNVKELLERLPEPTTPSYAPLATLVALLDEIPGPWPILDLQRTYVKSWKYLPENAKAGRAGQAFLHQALNKLKGSYSSLLDLYHPTSAACALIDPVSGHSLAHNDLTSIVRAFNLPLLPHVNGLKPVIAVSLPNGLLLGLTILATATYYIAAPIAHGNGVGPEQFKADVLHARSSLVIASPGDVERLELRAPWLAEAGVQIVLAELSDRMHLTLRKLDGTLANSSPSAMPVCNVADDISILLSTSGTSGTKKLVPLSVHSVICGVAMVVQSWDLSPSMRCLNQMPLNHVGGLIRNLFAPVFSGGSVICCSAFDANLFWDCVEDYCPTWYYASPSMHQGILEASKDRQESVAKSKIRLVCNAAGGLPPSLAIKLQDTFSINDSTCIVLPSYGMTECMPISTPPLHYKLEKPGTSGVSVGPEIVILDGRNHLEKTGRVGRICVRGAPVFRGYLTSDGCLDASCFNEDGWFDTGDVGLLDEDGYIYITGRSKEVINRGGELISPSEIEEAIIAAASTSGSPIFGRVKKALAFPVAHDVLQEVVGVVIVTPSETPRVCLRSIQQAVKHTLNQVKIPTVIVYMNNDLPTNNNKVLRIRLAERLGLPEISDNTPHAKRYLEAVCPPVNAPLSVNICSTPVNTTMHHAVVRECQKVLPDCFECHIRPDASGFYPELILAPRIGSAVAVDDLTLSALRQSLSKHLHSYQMPYNITQISTPFPRRRSGEVDGDILRDLLNPRKQAATINQDTTESKIADIFAQILNVLRDDINIMSDFFDLGGNSMAAGRLLSALRKEFNLRLSIDLLFTNRRVGQLAHLVNEKLGREDPHATEQGVASQTSLLPGCDQSCSSTSPGLMLMQLIPIGVIYPMKVRIFQIEEKAETNASQRALTWTVFMYFLSFTQGWATNKNIPGRLFDLVLSLAIGRGVTLTVSPLLAIAFKWLVIGRYTQGLYPMWSSYHTRWWMTEKIVCICGKGVLGRFNFTRILYYRLLGAKIGRNVWIDEGATLGEWDLLSVGDNTVLEKCHVRPFAAERNTSMYLGRISIGSDCSIGLCSIVAAGATIPDNTCIGPNSSSWEAADADEANRDLAASKVPTSHWLLNLVLGFPIYLVTNFVGLVPWLGCLAALVRREARPAVYDELRAIVIWFASPTRVAFHYSALAANVALGPIFFFAAFLVIKRTFDLLFGKLGSSPIKGRSVMDKFRRQLYNDLMPAPQFHRIASLFGGHYAITSALARTLGAKVGERVYWPGTGPSVQDWDLLDIGDDVVFGSRSHLVTSDGISSDFIRIRSDAMVADRVILLPGVDLGERVVMGSGAMSKRNTKYDAGSTWIGSKNGQAICLSLGAQGDNARPVSSPVHDSYNSSNFTLVSAEHSKQSSLYGTDHEKPSISFLEKPQEVKIPDTNSNEEICDSYAFPTNNVNPNESTSPFGRAFYQGKAPYRVWSQFEISVYSIVIAICNGVYWNVGSISAVQVVGYLFRANHPIARQFLAEHSWWRPMAFYVTFLILMIAIMVVQTLVVLFGIIVAKWIILGRRRPGNHDWDKSSYCQRWQLFLNLEIFRRSCYGGHGILGLLTGTAWLSLYFRALGARIGKDCALFAGGEPDLMFTEPDLLTLGDRVNVDDASLVCHINTRGNFDLNHLHVGARSVLRSGSRLLSGARMEDDTCLLEHTLVVAGDVVDAGVCAQGWPAEEFTTNRTPTLEVARVWKVKN